MHIAKFYFPFTKIVLKTCLLGNSIVVDLIFVDKIKRIVFACDAFIVTKFIKAFDRPLLFGLGHNEPPVVRSSRSPGVPESRSPGVPKYPTPGLRAIVPDALMNSLRYCRYTNLQLDAIRFNVLKGIYYVLTACPPVHEFPVNVAFWGTVIYAKLIISSYGIVCECVCSRIIIMHL